MAFLHIIICLLLPWGLTLRRFAAVTVATLNHPAEAEDEVVAVAPYKMVRREVGFEHLRYNTCAGAGNQPRQSTGTRDLHTYLSSARSVQRRGCIQLSPGIHP
jgi:hypothetical protein